MQNIYLVLALKTATVLWEMKREQKNLKGYVEKSKVGLLGGTVNSYLTSQRRFLEGKL